MDGWTSVRVGSVLSLSTADRDLWPNLLEQSNAFVVLVHLSVAEVCVRACLIVLVYGVWCVHVCVCVCVCVCVWCVWCISASYCMDV